MKKFSPHIFHNGSVRIRLLVIYSAVVFSTLVLVFLAIYRSVVTNLDDEVNQNLQERADSARRYFVTNTGFTPQDLVAFGQAFGGVSFSTTQAGSKGERLPTPAPIKADDFKPNISDLAASLIYLQVSFTNGQVWRVPDSDVMNRPETQADLHGLLYNSPGFASIKLKSGERVRVFTEPVIVRGQMVGQVQAVRSLDEIDSIVNSLTIPFVLIGCFTVIMLAGFGWVVTRRALAPIEKITEAAYRIGVNNDLTERIAIDFQSNDEVTRLGRAFNSMLDRVEKSFKAQKQFIADSSHELRTPLTVIRGNLDLLKRNPDPQNQTESLRAIEREVGRTQRLVEDLLLLAQADARQSVEMLPLQLDTLVLDIYMNTRVLADARHQNFKLGSFEPVTIEGDAERLKRAILNIVDNAIKYTPEEGTITVALYKGKKWARVVVTDNGAGIAERDQPLIFDRFYRVDKARSRTTGSTGLGLAIVKHIVEAHGGRITLESEVGKGSTFTIWLQHTTADDSAFSDDDDDIAEDSLSAEKDELTEASITSMTEKNSN